MDLKYFTPKYLILSKMMIRIIEVLNETEKCSLGRRLDFFAE